MKYRNWQYAAVWVGVGILGLPAGQALADEQLFGYVRGAETLPQGKSELY
jgi:hypothetical protein